MFLGNGFEEAKLSTNFNEQTSAIRETSFTPSTQQNNRINVLVTHSDEVRVTSSKDLSELSMLNMLVLQ